MQYLLWSTSYSQYCSTKSRTALRLAESRNVCTHAKACFFFFFWFCGFSMPDYWLLCIDMYLIYHTHTLTLTRWCFSTSVFPKMWKAFLYSRMSHFMFGWQSLILFCDDAYCSVWCKSTFQLDAIFFFFFLNNITTQRSPRPTQLHTADLQSCPRLRCADDVKGATSLTSVSLLLPIRPASLCNVFVCGWGKKKKTKQSTVWRIALPVEPFFKRRKIWFIRLGDPGRDLGCVRR